MSVTSYISVNSHHGKFATTSRLISCLVLEGLASAYFLPWEHKDKIVGLCLLYSQRFSASANNSSKRDNPFQGLLAAIPLRGAPELSIKNLIVVNGVHCQEIELVDPWDMLPHIYGLSESLTPEPYTILPDSALIRIQVFKALSKIGFQGYHDTLIDGYDAVQIWNRFSEYSGFKEKMGGKQLSSQLANTMLCQTYTYDHPKPLPTLRSSSIEWEQSVFEGHPIHPLHKLRYRYPPLPPLCIDDPNLENPKIRLVSFPKESIQLRGEFETLIAPLVNAMLNKTGDVHNQRAKYIDRVLMPVHELQMINIQEKFRDAIILPEENSVKGHALASIRTIAIPDILPNLTIKLSLGIHITSSLRVIEPNDAYFGPRFSENVLPRLSYDRKLLTAEREFASAAYKHPNLHLVKHCICIVREAVEYPATSNAMEDLFIPAAALTERIQRPDTDVTMVVYTWNLDSEEKRAVFLDRYIRLALQAFIPTCLKNRVAFEAHGQNVMARFDRVTGTLKGFVIRDFGALNAHNETVKRTCGVELDVLPKPNSPAMVVDSMEAAFKSLYHTLFHSHLQRLIRVLGMQHNGRGWEMVRRYFTDLVPQSDPMYGFFMLQEKIPVKSILRMRLEDNREGYMYVDVPNMILSRSQHYAMKGIQSDR